MATPSTAKLGGLHFGRLYGVDLTTVGPLILLPAQAGLRFIPVWCYLHLRTLAGGALTTAPSFRIGTNPQHDNIAPIYTPPLGVAVDAIGQMPLASPLRAPNIDGLDVIFEVTAASIGPAAMTGDVLIAGLAVIA